MPTILIEVAIRGMAIVASQVGGVPELVDEKTGFPVFKIDDVDDYVAAIQACIDDPERRIARAERLMDRAGTMYSQKTYVRHLTAIFECEK
jgi:glycosyltransferase involved in cell wall biosynthesis